MIRYLAIMAMMATPASAETLLAARTIPAQSIITAEDLVTSAQVIPGSVSNPDSIIGMETRVALYAGRPIRQGDVGFPAVVDRNQIIMLIYERNGLAISTEGRALGRGGPGDLIRVMNLSSRATVTARIGLDGIGYVSP
ncbi:MULTISPECIES: flagellar basal body P-ring formation chaperone FlgA [unclassified Yoonia]|uniref:flagellar basal body P-ring formation chaperone FlgA n=1 Tax=unclassified Yoonia TaxID=2629118 RepID=UPI002B002D1F|nr:MULTISPECIES: flagellar basal body P-ring formation chaperone FlgA [unclassified Yoonia]